MRSRITIDLDPFNRPVIQVEYSPSEDVRDKLVKRFLEGFAHESVWCRATFDLIKNDGTLLLIRPIPPNEFQENERELRMMRVKEGETFTYTPNTTIAKLNQP